MLSEIDSLTLVIMLNYLNSNCLQRVEEALEFFVTYDNSQKYAKNGPMDDYNGIDFSH